MDTLREFGSVELAALGLFVVFYLGFLLRIYRIYSQTKAHSKSVLAKIPLRVLYFGLMVLALLGPSFGYRSREIKSIGKDIFFVLDLSKSMDAFDVQPSRLEKVKIHLRQMISKFNSDRCGLIIFAQDAYLQSPLTYDGAALLLFTQAVQTSMVSNHSTNLAPALKMAIEKFESDSEKRADSEKSKIIVLISDGEDFGNEAEALAEEIAKKGIQFYAVGVGTDEGSRILEANSYKRNAQGEEVITKLNRESLENLAKLAKGRYFEISNERNDTQKLINSISLLEGQLREARTLEAQDDKYFYFLALAILLLLVDMFLSVKIFKA
jgi:Ca-activated chloride channel family protein